MVKHKKGNKLNDLVDSFAPVSLDFKANGLTFGDQEAQILTILNYPPKVGAGWLSRVAAIPGVICSIHIMPTETDQLIQSINKSIGELGGKLQQGGNALTMARSEQAMKDAQELLRKLDLEQQQVFDVVVVLMVLAPDKDSLSRRVRQVQASLAAAGMRARPAMFLQEQGLLAVGPWAICPQEIFEMAKRNMPSETVAASFPFTAAGINDGTGVLLGKDAEGGIVLVHVWARGGDRTNSNLVIMAKPGAGKSFTVKLLTLREWCLGTKFIIIDPEREYRDLCRRLNGAWINCGGGKGKINPLQVRDAGLLDDEDDDEEETDKENDDDVSGQGYLAFHLQTLRTFFSLYMRDLTDIEKTLLEETLVEVYAGFGVTWDTDPKTVEDWPTTKNLYEKIAEKAKVDPENYSRLAALLRRTAEGADAGLWAGQTTVSADNDLVVLDVYNLQQASDEVRRAQYFNVLTWAWSKIAEDRETRIVLVVDEAWLLIDPQTPQALQFLRETSKRIRKYEGGLWVISQNVVDFLDPAVIRFGQAILDNPTYKLLLAQGEKDLEALSQLMNLSEAETELLATAKRGEGLFVAGNQRIRLKIEAAPYEMEYLTGGGR